MKNKMVLWLLLATITVQSCSKQDTKMSTSIASESAYDEVNVAGSDCKTKEWLTDKHDYPKTKKVTFNGCIDEYGRSNYGAKFITNQINVDDAAPGDLVSYTTYDSGFYVTYDDGLTFYKAGSSKKFLLENVNKYGFKTYKVQSAKTSTDESGNIQNIGSGFKLTYVNETDFQKSGHSTGTGVTPNSNSFTLNITTPLLRVKGNKYPVSGVLSVKITEEGVDHLQVLDYGNGEKDNIATLRIDNGVPKKVTLPLEYYGEYLDE